MEGFVISLKKICVNIVEIRKYKGGLKTFFYNIK